MTESPKSKRGGSRPGTGGARKGSGRKVGSATLKTRAIADAAARSGQMTPLEVMLSAMLAMLAEADAMPDNRLEMLQVAASIAKDAAPYIHPRLQAIEHSGKVTLRSLSQEIAELNAIHGSPSSNIALA